MIQVLTNKLGAANVIATKQVNNLEQSVVEVVKYASILFLVSAGLFIVFSLAIRHLAADHFEKFALPQLLGGCALLLTVSLIAFAASSLIKPPSERRMVALADNLHRSYKYSMQLGDLSGAGFYASQLNALDSSNFTNRLLVDVVDLQRDLLLRPALLKTPKGALELSARLGRIDRTWDLAQQAKMDTTSVNFLEYELSATTAMVLWQTARTEKDEIVAACSALLALEKYQELGPKTSAGVVDTDSASPYIWFAYAYSKWAEVREPAGDTSCGENNPEKKQPALKSAKSYLKELSTTLRNFDNKNPNPVVEHIINYDRAAIEYYAAATKNYSTMLVNDAQFHFKTAPPDKAKFKAARDKAADEVLSAWNSFADKAKADPALQGNNLVLAMTGMPAALALRATALKGQDGRPAFDVNNCNDVKTKLSSTDAAARTGAASTPVGKLLDQLDEGVRNAACADQSAWDAKLVRFESSLTDTYGAGKTPAIEKANMLQKIEFESIATSLVACVVENDPNVGGDRDCGPDEVTQTRTLADWMKPRRTYDQNEVTRIAFVR